MVKTALTLLLPTHVSGIILLVVLSCLVEKLVDASLLEGDLSRIISLPWSL